jgi:signal transduction histidine kinase
MPSIDFNILLVEDEPDAAERMCQLLKKIDTERFPGKQFTKPNVTIARNQTDADEAIQAKAPPTGFDLIILDLRYPGRDGKIDDNEFAGMKWLPELRESQQQSAIAIQTAFPYGDEMNSAVTALRDLQADEFIPKSANWTSTQARLVEAWRRARERRWSNFLESGYAEFLHSRVFRAVAEDTRDEVYRRGSRFRNVADQLEVAGAIEASESIRREYNALIDEIVEITNPVDDTAERSLAVVESSSFLDGLQLFHSKLCSNSITISVERAKGEVRTYRRDLLTALHELMENAVETLEDDIEAGRHTNAAITLSSNPVQKPRAGIEIKISDTGPGFPETVLDTPFKRGFSTRAKKDKPFRGMGLYVAHRFMNRIFGSVSLTNKVSPERGAEVVLFVPDLGDLISRTR